VPDKDLNAAEAESGWKDERLRSTKKDRCIRDFEIWYDELREKWK
jgi:hypothetical protein